VTSRWHDLHIGDDCDESILIREALADIRDLAEATAVLVLQFTKSEGKAWEQGFFVGLNFYSNKPSPIVVVNPEGRTDCIFQRLRGLYTIVPSTDDAITHLKEGRA
jgi:hypothetical protein